MINLVNVVRLLAVALNPSTPRHEANAAARKARELGQSDGTVASLLSSLDTIREESTSRRSAPSTRPKWQPCQKRNCALDGEVASLREEICKVRAQNVALRGGSGYRALISRSLHSLRAPAPPMARKTWKSAFAFKAGIPVKQLNAWQTVDLIPGEWMALLDALTPERQKAASRQPWTDAERARLRALVQEGRSDPEIAWLLTAEFGRRRFEPAVTNLRRRLSRDEGWPSRPTSGKRGSGTRRRIPVQARRARPGQSDRPVAKPVASRRSRPECPGHGRARQRFVSACTYCFALRWALVFRMLMRQPCPEAQNAPRAKEFLSPWILKRAPTAHPPLRGLTALGLKPFAGRQSLRISYL